MKTILKTLLSLVVAMGACVCASAFPKALYVKKGDTYLKYNFGVAGDLKFSNGGKTLTITGYSEAIDLTAIDYITFSAPIDDNALTPSAQKEKLIEIGQDLYSKTKCSDHAAVLVMVDRFCNIYSDYYVPDEYYDVHSNADATHSAPRLTQKLLTALGQCVNGEGAAIRSIKRAGVELYRLDDYYGVYQANTSTERWEKIADADYMEIRFPAADMDYYKVKMVASGNVMHWDESDFAADIPARLDLTFVKGNTTLCSAYITFDVEKGMKLNSHVHFVSNNLVVDNDMRTDNGALTDDVVVTINNQKIVNAHSVLHGLNLLDYEDWKADMEEGVDDMVLMHDDFRNEDFYHYDYTYDNIAAERFSYGTSEADILDGRLQVRGKVSQIGKLYDKVDEGEHRIGDAYIEENGGRNRTYYWDSKELIESKISHLNNYSDISFYYDGTSQMQGFLAWDLDEEIEDWSNYEDYEWDPETQSHVKTWEGLARNAYYDKMPMLVFPDLTSYAIEDYFNNRNFRRLVDDYDAIIDDYYQTVGRKRPTDDYYDDY